MPQQTLFGFCGVKPPEAATEPEGGWLVVDLFCSIGGVSAAAKALGHRVVLAIDAEQWRLDIHELNHPECAHVCMKLGPKTEKKLDKLIKRHVPEGDRHRLWIHASPPCQTNSKLQSMEYWNSVEKRREKKGVGLRLLRWACDYIVKTKPAQWSLEEVDDFNQRVNGELRKMKHKDPSMVDFQVFNFADFGLPQTRKRVIGGRPATIHALRHAPQFRPAKRTSIGEAMAAVGTMPENAHWYHGPNHVFPKKEKMRRCPKTPGKWTDKTAHCYELSAVGPPCTTHLTNWLDENFDFIRRLSGHETQAYCGFDADFVWPEKISRARMLIGVGNAVPPKFAKCLFRAATTPT